jgi:hypothetical protein
VSEEYRDQSKDKRSRGHFSVPEYGLSSIAGSLQDVPEEFRDKSED